MLTGTGDQCDATSSKVPDDGPKSRKMHNDFENYLEQIRHYTGNPLPIGNERGRPRGDFGDFREMTPGQQILYVIDKFQAVRIMQNSTNSLFGFVLAVNTGLTMFMCVVLKYMLIWNFGNLVKYYYHNPTVNVTAANESSIVLAINNGSGHQMVLVTDSPSQWIMFAILNACFGIRLLVLVICLGNVHYASTRFNATLSLALLQVQKIVDVIEAQGLSNKYFQGRSVITSTEATAVLGFITENSANPLAFSAAGLFCFSRNLMLVIISIVTTYLVFLLQV